MQSNYLHADWMDNGACAEGTFTHIDFFPDKAPTDEQEILDIQDVCSTCPVRFRCFDRANSEKLEGVWGGHYFPYDWWKPSRNRKIEYLQTEEQKEPRKWTITYTQS